MNNHLNHRVIFLVLITVLAVGWTLGAYAQGPVDRDTFSVPDKFTAFDAEKEPEVIPDMASVQQLEYYKFISANTFVPNNSNMTYVYHDAGCMYRTGGGNWTEHTVQLPQGAVIDSLRVYFYDNDSSNNAMAYLAAYDGLDHTTTIATVSSSGTPGQSLADSGSFAYTVDNSTAAVSVSLSYGSATTNSLRICGVRLHYYYAYSTVNLPLIIR